MKRRNRMWWMATLLGYAEWMRSAELIQTNHVECVLGVADANA